MSHLKYPINNPVYFDELPIGAITGFHPNVTTPPLEIPKGWTSLDGQTISDPDSPLDGVTLPDWNGTGKFLRGTTGPTGAEQTDTMQGHWHSYRSKAGGGSSQAGVPGSGNSTTSIYYDANEDKFNVENPKSDGINGTPRVSGETRPVNAAIQWIIKYKEGSAQANHIKVRTLEYEEIIPSHPVESYELITASGPVTPTSNDHTAFVDSDLGSFTVTVPDGLSINARVTIVSDGVNKVTLAGTGLTGEEVPSNESRAYVWTGTAWLLASGGGGGGLGNIQVPQPKTWVSKYKDYTNTVNVTNQWGDGIYQATVRSSTDSVVLTSVLILDTANYSPSSNNWRSPDANQTSDAGLVYDDSTNQFFVGSASGIYYIVEIFRWEDDPDNLPLQTIPADPALIKDWVIKYEDLTGSQSIVTNVWGDGRYIIDGEANAFPFSTIVTVKDGLEDQTLDSAVVSTDSQNQGRFRYRNNAFEVEITGTFTNPKLFRISRWEDVAGQDAQLNPPVDGWETVFEDDGSGAVVSIPNTTGLGYYRFTSRVPSLSRRGSQEMVLTTLAENTQIAIYDNVWFITYNSVTNAFELTSSGSYAGAVFLKIDKFNSLVNVLHTYHPDPRSVAQKDWVQVYDGGASTVTNVWGEGHYLLETRISGALYSAYLRVTEPNVTNGVSGDTSTSADGRFRYTASTNVFESLYSGDSVERIYRWQDSQANDAPREVLDDGWETVYGYDYNSTDTTVQNIWGTGTYEIMMYPGGSVSEEIIVYHLSLEDLTKKTYAVQFVAPGTSTSYLAVWYDPSDNNFKFTAAGSFTGATFIRIRKFTGLLRISAQYNLTSLSDGPNQVKAINTDAGDVDAGLPSSPALGDLFEAWNTGTNGNHVTGLPNSITLGDGKGIRLRYVDGWKYEDVIIDEYSDPVEPRIKTIKWSGGRMVQTFAKAQSGGVVSSFYILVEFQESFVDTNYVQTATLSEGSTTNHDDVRSRNKTVTGFEYQFRQTTKSSDSYNVEAVFTAEGRWKTGV